MYPKILFRMREGVRLNKLIFTFHALEELDADDLFKEDIGHCILHGKIVARQWDEAFVEHKYLIDGESLVGENIEVVAKLREDNTVIITVYLR